VSARHLAAIAFWLVLLLATLAAIALNLYIGIE
jgi:hypothetical protein